VIVTGVGRQWFRVAVTLEPDVATPVLQPLPKPPLRSSDRLLIPVDALPPPLLGVEVQALTWRTPQVAGVASPRAPGSESTDRCCLYVVLSLALPDGTGTTPPDDAALNGSGKASRLILGSYMSIV
jgi:hypothetical protein